MRVKRIDGSVSVPVGTLSDGTVFDSYGVVLMKIYNARRTEDVRAIDVKDGSEYQFRPDTNVIPLDAELIIKGERNED